jgi:hypothetical protein
MRIPSFLAALSFRIGTFAGGFMAWGFPLSTKKSNSLRSVLSDSMIFLRILSATSLIKAVLVNRVS